MQKSFIRIPEGPFTVAVHATATLINTGVTSIAVLEETTADALGSLTSSEAKIVKDSLFSILPGQSRKLTAGTYVVDFNKSVSASCIGYLTRPIPKKPVEPSEPQTPPAS